MAKKKSAKKGGSFRKFLIITAIVIACLGAFSAWMFYMVVVAPNVDLEKREQYFLIPTGSDFEDVKESLKDLNVLRNVRAFDFVAEQKNYKENVKPGRYLLIDGMSNNRLVNLLRSGKQEPVTVTFTNVRFKEELARKVSRFIEADSTQIIGLLNDSEFVSKYGFDTDNVLTLFLPNSYEFWWNTSAEEFVERMAKEYKIFCMEDRNRKAQNLRLTQSEVSILASIIQKETNRNDEKPTIAGVYYNRLRKGMPLQADPTLDYANRDFEARRVLHKHKIIDSPYNTYRYRGLPPGPICLPSAASIDAVLDIKPHNYLYFCAKPDGSGSHSFAASYAEHLKNARAFQKKLNKRNIHK